jgi:ATP-dependent protease ClpP protease subunit
MEYLRERDALASLANKATSPRPNWYQIDNKADDEATIYLYSDIGWIGATAEEFVSELRDITADSINVRINSYGGSVFDGIAIYNALRSHPAQVTTQVDAIAASIASVIAQAGDHRIVMESAEVMIHEATAVAINATPSNLRELADIGDNQSEKIADIYASRSGGDRDEFLELMRAGTANMGTWFGHDEAVEAGLADEVMVPAKTENKTTLPDPEPAETATGIDFMSVFDDPEDFEWSIYQGGL